MTDWVHTVKAQNKAERRRKAFDRSVPCVVEETELENDDGRQVPGVLATCRRCDHHTQSFGTSDRSITRCLVLMREQCPNDERNYYLDETSDDGLQDYAGRNAPTPIP
jgi:hypothetical protein